MFSRRSGEKSILIKRIPLNEQSRILARFVLRIRAHKHWKITNKIHIRLKDCAFIRLSFFVYNRFFCFIPINFEAQRRAMAKFHGIFSLWYTLIRSILYLLDHASFVDIHPNVHRMHRNRCIMEIDCPFRFSTIRVFTLFPGHISVL